MTNVSPTAVRPSHNVSLSDGVTTVGLILCDGRGTPTPQLQIMPLNKTALKIAQGGSRYDDMELPYSSTIQSSFEGGRGQKMFELDKSRFYDSNNLDTMSGKAFLSGLATYTTGYYSSATTGSRNGDYALTGGSSAVKIVASSITPGANIIVRRIRFYLKKATATAYPLTLTARIYSDSSGPNTLTASSDTKTFNVLTTSYVAYDFEFPATTLTASTKYWIGLEISAADTINVGKDTSETGNAIYGYTSSWASEASNQAIVFTLYTVASGEAKFFHYKGALYAVTKPDDWTTPTVWMNGYRGVATSNSSDLTKLNTTLNLTGVDLAGKVVKITKGPGSTEEFPYRTIVSNTTTGTNDAITVDKVWKVAHTTATEYVVLGCDTWQQVLLTAGGAAIGITKPITDVVVVDDLVWFAQGSEAVMYRFNQYNNSGTWTTVAKAETSMYAEYLGFQCDQNGKRWLWRSKEGTNYVSRVAVPASYSADALAFGTDIACGSNDERITGLEVYGEPPILYVFKEGSFGAVNEQKYAETPIYEMASVRDWVNGRAHIRQDVYLYFSLLEGLERFYNNHLDDIGPNRDEGLPEGRQGIIRHMVVYPGRIYAALDAGDYPDSYSSVLCYTPSGGWHEVYRAPGGKRVRRLFIQPIPELVDRLWISEEEDLVWMPITLYPLKDEQYQFCSSGSVTTSWIYHDMLDVNKWFNKVTLFSENLYSTTTEGVTTYHQYVTLEYQTDDDQDEDDWTLVGTFDTSPVDTLELSATKNVSGRRIRFRFTLYTDDADLTPVMEAWRMDSIVRIQQGKGYKLNFLLEDYQHDLQGIRQNTDTVNSILDQFEDWSNSDNHPCPLTLRSLYNTFDNKYVFIDQPVVTLIPNSTDPVRKEMAICSVVVQEA